MMIDQNRGRNKFKKFRFIIIFLSKILAKLPKRIRIILLGYYQMTRGYRGLLIRYVLLKSIAVNCGDNVSIHKGVYLLHPEKLDIGDNVSVHPMCYIDATGGIKIGNDVSIAHGVTLMSTSHCFENLSIPTKDQGLVLGSTLISDNVWIGAKATILSGRKLNLGCIIASNCVVTKDVAAFTIVGGVPNRILKHRKMFDSIK